MFKFVKLGPRSLGAISNQGDGNISSLKSFVTRGKANQVSGSSPFATEITSSQLRNFEDLERQLTSFMTEKSSLEEELGRLVNYFYDCYYCYYYNFSELIFLFIDFNKEEDEH